MEGFPSSAWLFKPPLNSDPTGFEEEISAGSVVAVVVAQSQFFLSRK